MGIEDEHRLRWDLSSYVASRQGQTLSFRNHVSPNSSSDGGDGGGDNTNDGDDDGGDGDTTSDGDGGGDDRARRVALHPPSSPHRPCLRRNDAHQRLVG